MYQATTITSLTKVTFKTVDFNSTFCQAVAKALKERSEITDLISHRCSLPEGEGAL
jgi:hypothetical protein